MQDYTFSLGNAVVYAGDSSVGPGFSEHYVSLRVEGEICHPLGCKAGGIAPHIGIGFVFGGGLDGWRIPDVNDAFTTATGGRREEVAGRSEPDLEFWGDAQTREQLRRQIQQTGRVDGIDIQLCAKHGGISHYPLSAETVMIQQDHCVLSMMLDITERKQTEMQLMQAIEAVMQDTSRFGRKIVGKLESLTQPNATVRQDPAMPDLTPRAVEVLSLVAQGLSDADIAERLGIARNTIRNHIAAIFSKLDVHRRGAMVVRAREHGFAGNTKALTTLHKPGLRIPS